MLAPNSAEVYELFINGKVVAASERERLERRHPSTHELVATYARATRGDTLSAVQAAKRAFESSAWRQMVPSERARLIERAGIELEKSDSALARTIMREVGKPIDGAMAEVKEGCALWRYAAASLRSLRGELYPALAPGFEGQTFFEPVGVVGLILPWNFPFLVAAERLPFILAAGCTVVVKPSEYAAGTAFQIAEVLRRIGVPDGVYNVVTGVGDEAGEALVESPDVSMISFTGSTENGRRVAERASRTFKRLSLELGGKSPVVLFADADFERAVQAVISGFTYNAGQCCIATSRLIIERSAKEKFKRLLVEQLASLAATFTQPAATEAQHRRVVEFIDLGKREAEVVYGGSATLPYGSPVSPVVFDNIPRDSRIGKEEIFGPVLSIYPFNTEDEAVAVANDTIYGLAACVWSGDVSRAIRVAKRIRAGRLWVNSAQENFPEMPVGGFGASGLGREAGTFGIRTYCEVKSMIIRTQS